jgi:hypothetical protein
MKCRNGFIGSVKKIIRRQCGESESRNRSSWHQRPRNEIEKYLWHHHENNGVKIFNL